MANGRRRRPRLVPQTSQVQDSATLEISPEATGKETGPPAATTPQKQIVEHLEEMVQPAPDTASTTPIVSAYASLVDPEEGTELRYMPTTCINGLTCAKLANQDIREEVEYWNTAVLCSVLGANPPLEVIKGFILRIWGSYEIDKILQVRRGIFLVRFQNPEDRDKVLKKGIYHFDSKPLMVKGWNPNMDLCTESSESLPIWIRLPELDLKYWGMNSLSKLCSTLGIPLKTDQFTKNKTMIRYARELVEIKLEGSFPEFIEFFNEFDVLIRQPIHYEWLSVKCLYCGMYGHKEDVCKKKSKPRKEWRVKQKEPETVPMPTPEVAHTADFQNATDQTKF
ncbi:hypothetical protein Cgig2_000800 [Carnegiea gigantea]|uniref:DUF4283 domain-containing protein n=1 Tax=Carnegiea gigantea TaxID=171969 RepID=A0A9Q1GSA8_9CARY|nr:hypothetical protein Cgig2_000800 [Carnegiea gigantea]